MVRNPSISSSGSEVASTNLERILQRLKFLLVTPDANTEELLRTSYEERLKVAANIKYSRNLLLELEQDASAIRITSRKQDTQSMLVKQRHELDMLEERLHELNELGDHGLEGNGGSDEEDLIGEDTPDESTETETDEGQTPPGTASMTEFENRSTGNTELEVKQVLPIGREPHLQTESSTLRHRREKDELLKPTATSTALESKTAEQLMTHNRTEQEELTSSMLSMAAMLKQQSRAFAATLEGEKDILDRAAQGLDKNELGLETAQTKMGYLSRLTEGKGWLQRMILYGTIAILWMVALFIMLVMPKLRF